MSMALACALAAGCASTGQTDLLESRLRHQEDSINQLQAQLQTSQNQLHAARRENVDLKTQLAHGGSGTRAEQFSSLGQVQGIALNKLLTGGLDRDGIAGDELLSAVIVPTDADGNLVKVPGEIAVTVLDLSKPEGQQRVGRWEYSAKESDALWHQGWLGSGYMVRVPWQSPPQSANLLVHARLKTVDGRQFDTSQSIHITPPAQTSNVAAAGRNSATTVAATGADAKQAVSDPAAPMPLSPPQGSPSVEMPPVNTSGTGKPGTRTESPGATDAAWWNQSAAGGPPQNAPE
jgi:hypothetical protein